MKILSLFDGMSVAQQALKDAGKKVDKYYASEIDPYAIAVTQLNHQDTIQLGSVTDIRVGMSWNGVPHYKWDIDLMVGGSPCQDLSIAKKGREGLSGSRSGLFWEYVRIRDEVKPKYFILENVASMPKEAKDTISEALGVQPVMINASLVSAQNRKRLFWVGKWNGEKYEQVEIPQPEDSGILLKDILEGDVDEKYFLNESALKTLNRDSYGAKGSIANPEEKTKTLTASMGGGRGAKTGLYAISKTLEEYTKDTSKLFEEKANPLDASYYKGLGKRGSKWRTQVKKWSGECPHNCGQNDCVHNFQIRKLTPTECLRLQSMPECDIIESIWHHITKNLHTNKTDVFVATSNGNHQKLVSSAEAINVNIPVKYVIKNSNTNEVLKEFTVQQSVDIQIQNTGDTYNQNTQIEWHLNVMGVEETLLNKEVKSEEDFARFLVSTNITEAKIILTGLEVLHLKDNNFTLLKSGNKPLDKFGQEINHFVPNVAYTIKNQDTPIISTTLNHLRLKKMTEQILTILSYYASNVIDGLTLKKILKNNSWICPISNKQIERLTYFDKAEYKGKPISNTQRYKMCGNAFNKEVIVHIINNLK